jgi:arylsulfatase A-like enzyme
MYEESLRNPLIIKWPKVTKAGTRRKEMVQNIDYAPTILEAAGIKVLQEIQGRSLVPLLKGSTLTDWRKSILYTYYGKDIHAVISHRGIRTEHFKLIEFYTKGEWEFYDLLKDPLEMKSEYNNPEYENRIRNMKHELKTLMQIYQLS